MPIKKTHNEYVEDTQRINPNIEVIEQYVNSKFPILHKCKIDGYEWKVIPNSILNGEGCPKCGGHKRRTHDEYLSELQIINKNVIPLETYINANTKILHKCLLDDYEWYCQPNNLLNGRGCPCCAGKVVVIGKTDLWTTRSDIATMLINKNDGYIHTSKYEKAVQFRCPNCGSTICRSINYVCKYGLTCDKCGDGISYPNKFGRAFLDQLPITNVQYEYNPYWAGRYQYDNYFMYKNNEYILEMDGGFHYDEHTCSKKTLAERQQIDKIKTQLATKNGIKVIRIDCQISDADYIKNHILESELNFIFDLQNIDWSLCDKHSRSNLVKEVCSLYMNKTKDLNIIKDELHISIITTRRYAKIGAKLGWCDYMPETGHKIAANKRTHKYYLVNKNEEIIKDFFGIKSIIDYVKLTYGITMNSGNISIACKTHKPYKGINFRYADEYV